MGSSNSKPSYTPPPPTTTTTAPSTTPSPPPCEEISDFTSNKCQELFAERLYSLNSKGQVEMSLQELHDFVIPSMNKVLPELFHQIDVYSPVYNELAQIFINTCRDFPGGCYPFLESYCSGITEDTAAAYPVLRSFCGCFIPSSLGSNFPRECTLLCLNYETVPLAPNGVAKPCNGHLCAISLPVLSVLQKNIPTATTENVKNVCNGCTSKTPCICEIVSTSTSTFPPNISYDIQQSCLGNSKCYTLINGKRQEVPCDLKISKKVKEPQTGIPIEYWMVLGFFILILSSFVYLLVERPLLPPDKSTYI